MRAYVLGVLGTVLFCSVLSAIAPEGKTASVVKGVTRLACVIVIISPVLHFFKIGEISSDCERVVCFFSESVIQTDKDFIKYYSDIRARLTADSIAEEIKEKYGIQTKVTLDLQTIKDTYAGYAYERLQIVTIRLQLEGDNMEQNKEKQRDMQEFLKKNYCCEVLIE